MSNNTYLETFQSTKPFIGLKKKSYSLVNFTLLAIIVISSIISVSCVPITDDEG